MTAYDEFIHEEKIIVAENMMRYGGSFMKCLGEALLHADSNNTRKIKKEWPEEWYKYLEEFKEMKENE